MEDFFSVAYQQTEDERDLEYAFIGIYDGHGGAEAAAFAKEHLMESIIKHKSFWSDNDEDVLRAIKDGYIATHYAMWKEQDNWPRTASGLPSTAGTTASVAFIRRGKIYVGHVGDSGIVLGYQTPNSNEWKARPLTRDHKPENAEEMSRIQQCGGKVVTKSGVPRVVWNRPRIGHQGPVRRSTPIDEIPFLAVARSLGDLWSYNSRIDQFVVSPNPDCSVVDIDTSVHRCLIFGTDGLFNMLSPQVAVHIVHQTEMYNEMAALSESDSKTWLNPSKMLVEKALERWHSTKMRADNTSVVTLMLDPPGPPHVQVLRNRKKNITETIADPLTSHSSQHAPTETSKLDVEEHPITKNDANAQTVLEDYDRRLGKPCLSKTDPDPQPPVPSPLISPEVSSNYCLPLKERNFTPKTKESTAFDPREPNNDEKENLHGKSQDDSIQINEVSSSSTDENIESSEEGNKEFAQHNLRSSAKKIPAASMYKRKSSDIEIAQDEPIRKSVRLDRIKRRSEMPVGRQSRLYPSKSQSTIKQSLVQRILRGKKLSLKKSGKGKRQTTKRKLKMILHSVGAKNTLVRLAGRGLIKKKADGDRFSQKKSTDAPKVAVVNENEADNKIKNLQERCPSSSNDVKRTTHQLRSSTNILASKEPNIPNNTSRPSEITQPSQKTSSDSILASMATRSKSLDWRTNRSQKNGTRVLSEQSNDAVTQQQRRSLRNNSTGRGSQLRKRLSRSK